MIDKTYVGEIPKYERRCPEIHGNHKFRTLSRELVKQERQIFPDAERTRRCTICGFTIRELMLPLTKKERQEVWGV